MSEEILTTKPVEPVASVSMIAAFRASGEPGQDVLQYDNLPQKSAEARSKEYPLMDQFWSAETDSLDEEKQARSLAIGYLVLNGNKLREVPDTEQPLWSERFTSASAEVYGEPEASVASSLLANQSDTFSTLRDNPGVDQAMLDSFLSKITPPRSSETNTTEELLSAEEVAAFGNVVWQRYGTVLSALKPEQLGLSGKVPHETIKQIFDAQFETLASEDNIWNGWKSEVVAGEGMSTNGREKILKIGNRGNYTADRLMPLFAHEALVHGLRDMRDDSLPGTLDAEEGLGILTEYALTGKMIDRHVDRYIDVALALGTTGNAPLNRTDLHELHTQRLMLRKQAAGETPDYDTVSRSAWNHVDRIYRGSLGNEQIGVNTKDIAYYQGYVKISKYIASEHAAGKSMDAIYNYIMQAPFDPTDARHRKAIAS